MLFRLALVVYLLAFLGCGYDDNPWSGTWELVTVDGESVEQLISKRGATIVTNRWTFDNNGTMQAKLTLLMFQGREEYLVTLIVTGTYSLSSSSYIVTMKIDVTEGSLRNYPENTADTAIDTGIWYRTGNTLTLNRDEVLVFRKI